jgi:hypothetical protein
MTDCECVHWASVRNDIRLLTGHHESCPNLPDPVRVAKDLIRDLIRGIEAWAADEDGVHDEVWEAYKRGKAVIGEFDWKEERP